VLGEELRWAWGEAELRARLADLVPPRARAGAA